MVVGASGAAKWLVLHGLDAALFASWFTGRTTPLHLYGTSIGAWKLAAAASHAPTESFDRLAHAYIHQFYQGKITREQVIREGERILSEFLPPGLPEEILGHPWARLHFSAVRCRGPLGTDNQKVELAALALTWLANRASRRILARICPPTLFHHPAEPPPFANGNEFPGGTVPLSAANFRQAILASGSIPYVMKGMQGIAGAPAGVYRDGGLYHYHPAFDFLASQEGIVLYPHFYPTATLGWLDKGNAARKADGSTLADVLLLAPSKEFIATLPLRRIPDRRDFERMAGQDEQRIAFWEKTVAMSSALGEEFLASVESGSIREKVQRIP